MNLSFRTPKTPELKARLALRVGKWKSALPFYVDQASADDQNYAQWNLLGDVHYRAGDHHAAFEAWQKALDGYAIESLHENVLGIGRKIAKRCPEETGVHRAISEAYLGLEYHADAISAFRSYIKLCKQATSAEKKSWFRKILACEIRQPHLLEELVQILDECGLEDIELQRDLEAYVGRMQENADVSHNVEAEPSFETPIEEQSETYAPSANGLMTIESDWSNSDFSVLKQDAPTYHPSPIANEPVVKNPGFESVEVFADDDLPLGQGKDHFDLGVVYAEMKLWDAAITEFQTARRDRSMRGKATIELAQCLKNANDPHRALRLLEEESASSESEADAQNALNYHMGVLNELLGNIDAARQCFERVGGASMHAADASAHATRLATQNN